MKGIVLDSRGDLDIIPRRTSEGLSGLYTGETTIQDTTIVVGLNQGELKSDPLLGPNLNRYIRSRASYNRIERALKIHLERAGLRFSAVSELLSLNLKRI